MSISQTSGRVRVSQAPHATRPQPEISTDGDDLIVQDHRVEILAWPGVVRAGIGAEIFAHAGVVVDPTDGAVVHLAPGAGLEEHRPGALERGDYTVVAWTAPVTP